MAIVTDILTRAGDVLQDAGFTRWTRLELVRWFNDALRDLVNLDPTACEKNQVVSLIAGAKQALPADAVMLLDVVGNVNSDGATGRQIRMADRAVLDATFPKWQSESQKSYASNVMYDLKNRKTFYVHPPVIAGTQIELVYSYFPGDVTADSTVPVDAMYHTPLLDYVLYKAFAKESEQPASAQRAVAHFQAFTQGVQALITYRGGGQPQK